MTSTTSTPNLPTQAQWDAANQFLQELLINNNLAQGYLNIAQQANGQDNASTRLTDWLQGQGYDTTPALIYGALVAVQNTTLGYWLGIYGQSYQQNPPIAAPVLAILPDIDGNITPYLNGVALVNYTFKSVESDGSLNPILSWGLESNSTAGEITFYYTPEVNTDPNPPTGYTGNWFQGTLQTGANVPQESFFGALGSANAEALPTVSLSGEDPHQQQSESWLKQTIAWLNTHPAAWVGVGLAGLVVGGSLIYGGYKLVRWAYQSIQQRQQEREQARQKIEDDFQDKQYDAAVIEQWYEKQDQKKKAQESLENIEKEEYDAEIRSLKPEIKQEVGNEQKQLEDQPQNNKLASPKEIKAMMDQAFPKMAEIWNNANNSEDPSAFANAEIQIRGILNQMSSAIEPDNGADDYKSPLKKYIKTGNYDRLDQNNPEHRFIKALEDIKYTSRDQWLRSKQRQELIKNWEEIKPQRMEKLKEVKRQKEELKNQKNDQQGSEDQFADKKFGENPQPPSQFQPDNNAPNTSQNLDDGNSGIDQSTVPTPPKITQQPTSQKVDVNQKGSTSQQSQPNPLSDQKIQQVEQKNQSSDQDSNDGGDEIEGEEGK
ncbi:hypothetical protein IQ224_05260 [Microcystis sp. LEGE 00066]|uniref:hypothetical protein n=1 Tax=Microcystis sp. LEGE 00066 TaxID=1828685 RepID=UPI00187ED461|nr:hypothetical protein [Microcystis sp. LEGE 00066]MBE9261646.1 hypothetical protein [Microcystis sp. LEGE 00066]